MVTFFFLSFLSFYCIFASFKAALTDGFIYLSMIGLLEDRNLHFDKKKRRIFYAAKIAFLSFYWDPFKIRLMTALKTFLIDPSPCPCGGRSCDTRIIYF